MQFHVNGFRAGDPEVMPSGVAAGTPAGLPDTVDVLIVGCGPAGLVLAAQLAAFPEIRTRIQAWGVMDVLRLPAARAPLAASPVNRATSKPTHAACQCPAA